MAHPTSVPPDVPLAERLRPSSLDDFIGQAAVVGKTGSLRLAIEAGALPSIILWGPPGVGKTTLAHLLSAAVKRPLIALSAVQSGVKEVRDVLEKAARPSLLQPGKPVLFIDEIHRFNKGQQDSLLGAVERGVVTLIGATTENPSFEVNAALLSRTQVYVLEALGVTELQLLLERALKNDAWLRAMAPKVMETNALFRLSGGDGRRLLNTLELVVGAAGPNAVIDDAQCLKAASQANLRYDKSGEEHYDVASALIKSIRGSDPNAAVYWLARMIEGGEDPLFIARRLVISAAEDVGLANPSALTVANAAYQCTHAVGYPECRIVLSECALYLATSAKSNSAYRAIDDALSEVRESGNLPVPLHLRNAPTKLMKQLGYGAHYEYAHSHTGNFVEQDYLPAAVEGKTFYEPGSNQRESALRQWLKGLWKSKYSY